MLNALYKTQMGAKFKLTVLNADGSPKSDTNGPYCNMILDSAVTIMPTGFSTLPIPVLGSSAIAEAANQTGVLTPQANMVCYENKELWAAKYSKISDTEANVSWGHRYSYRNTSTAAIEIAEVGIPNFNRAVFRDGVNSYIWTVSPNEILLVEMDFNIRIKAPINPIAIAVLDQDGKTTKNVTVNMRVCDAVSAGTPQWYKALSKPSNKVYYTTDNNFNGTVKPVTAQQFEVSLSSNYDYKARTIEMSFKHRGKTGGESIKGILFNFGCITPVLTAVFSEPLYVGGGYTFEAKSTLTW